MIGGSLVSAMMGNRIRSHYDIGYYFQAIDPSVFRNIKEFKAENTLLVEEIKASSKRPGTDEILLPGEQGARNHAKCIEEGLVTLSEGVLSALIRM